MVCIKLCCDHNMTVSGGGGAGDWRRIEEAHLDAGYRSLLLLRSVSLRLPDTAGAQWAHW